MTSAVDRPIVLHIISGLDTGGAEMMLLKLVSASRSVRHEIISLRDDGQLGERLRQAGATVHSLNIHRLSGMVPAAGRLRRLVGRLRPAYVQGWMNHGNAAASLLTPRGTPILWNVRQSIVDFRYEKAATAALIKFSPWLSRRPSLILYNSRTGAEQHEALGYPPGKRRIIPNGFDIDLFRPDPSSRRAGRKSIGVEDDDILVGLVARFHPMKNHSGAVEGFARALRRNPRLRLLLVGAGTEPSNPAMAALLADPATSKRCSALGLREDIPQLTRLLDIGLNASVHGEGFPNAVGEAMASGVPCIVTDVGDSADIVGTTGVVVTPGCPERLADALVGMAAWSPEERDAAGRRARDRIIEHYSIAAVARQYENLYLSLPPGLN